MGDLSQVSGTRARAQLSREEKSQTMMPGFLWLALIYLEEVLLPEDRAMKKPGQSSEGTFNQRG